MRELVQSASGLVYPIEKEEYKQNPPTIRIQDEESRQELGRLFAQIVNHSALSNRGIRLDPTIEEIKKCRREILFAAISSLLGDVEFETPC